MDIAQLLLILKQYGPLVAISLFLLIWLTKRIDTLLDRNTLIYEKHIEHLWETQKQLMAAVLGAQDSSEAAPTVDDMKQKALAETSRPPSNLAEGGAKQ
jgi:hypothetical protein